MFSRDLSDVTLVGDHDGHDDLMKMKMKSEDKVEDEIDDVGCDESYLVMKVIS